MGESFVPRFVPGVLIAVVALVLVALPRPAHGAEPLLTDVMAAGEAFGLDCEQFGETASCIADDGDRFRDTYIWDLEDGFQVTASRNRFDTETVGPIEQDLMSYFDALVTLAVGDDPGAHAWLASMNDGPVDHGVYEIEGWTMTWGTTLVGVSDPPVPNVTLDLFYFPAMPDESNQPAATPERVEQGNGLGEYLAAYGLACSEPADAIHCFMALNEGATYQVITTRDDAGEAVAIFAEVRSIDASFPSDGISFLLGVAERTPVDDPGALLAWINQALSAGGSADGYVDGDWTAAWTDVAGGVGRTVSLELTREEAAAEPDAPAAPVEPTGPAASLDGAVRPFAESVPTIGEVSTDPAVLLQSAALAALIVFLMPFPSQLFNSTLEAHEDEVKRWFRLDRLGPVAGGIGAFWASWPGVVLFTLLAALLFSFLDPTFGLDVSSAATLIGMLAGIVLVTAAFAVPAVLAHRRIGDSPALKVVPISLLIGVACVLVSRVTDFQPGYLYGLLIGIVFARELSAADEGRATALGACLMLAVALVSWLALGVLPDGDGFGLVVARMSLAALMVAGLEGVVFGLLPMRFLPGEPLYAWNRLLWGALLAIGAFAFFHVLINPSSGYLSDTSRTPLFTVVALLVGFSLISVAFWAWFRFRDQPPVEEQTAA